MVPVLECAAVIDIIVVCDSLLYKVGHKYIQLEFHCGHHSCLQSWEPGFKTSTQGLKIIKEKGLPLH